MAFKLTIDGHAHEIEIIRRRPHLVLRIDGRVHEIDALGERGDGRRWISIDGRISPYARALADNTQIVRFEGRTFDIGLVDPRAEGGGVGGGLDVVRAPMPGRVVAVHTSSGAIVKRGEALVTIESMKLQMALAAPRDGVIAALPRSEGETIEKDEIVVRLEPAGG
jgi:biotin carboxyl carrier protein